MQAFGANIPRTAYTSFSRTTRCHSFRKPSTGSVMGTAYRANYATTGCVSSRRRRHRKNGENHVIPVSWSPLWAVVLALAAVLVLAVAAEAEPVTPEALMQEMRALRKHESPAEPPLDSMRPPSKPATSSQTCRRPS